MLQASGVAGYGYLTVGHETKRADTLYEELKDLPQAVVEQRFRENFYGRSIRQKLSWIFRGGRIEEAAARRVLLERGLVQRIHSIEDGKPLATPGNH